MRKQTSGFCHVGADFGPGTLVSVNYLSLFEWCFSGLLHLPAGETACEERKGTESALMECLLPTALMTEFSAARIPTISILLEE